jgi:HlyD family secretion protein
LCGGQIIAVRRYPPPFLFGLALAVLVSACNRPRENRYHGYVEGEFVYTASPVAGTLEQILVDRGDVVVKDQELFRLEVQPEQGQFEEAKARLDAARATADDVQKGQRPTELAALEARLAQARADAKLAKTEFERHERLYRERSIAEGDLDRSRALFVRTAQLVSELTAQLSTAKLGARTDQITAAINEVEAARAALARASWAVEQKVKLAPQSGTVFDTYYRAGEWVSAASPVLSLLPPENIRIRFFVPEEAVSKLTLGNNIKVLVDGVVEPYAAQIAFISPVAEYTPPVIFSKEMRSRLSYLIEAEPARERAAELHPGQPIDVLVPEA